MGIPLILKGILKTKNCTFVKSAQAATTGAITTTPKESITHKIESTFYSQLMLVTYTLLQPNTFIRFWVFNALLF